MARLSFDSNVCKLVGANAATIYNNIKHWCEKNEANGDHFYDGMFWTYNSKKAFEQLFKCFSERQIRTALDKLVKEGLVFRANYNKAGYDQTKWYAINPEFERIIRKCAANSQIVDPAVIRGKAHLTFSSDAEGENAQNIAETCNNPHMTKKSNHRTKKSNGSDLKVQPIPNIKPNIKINNKKENSHGLLNLKDLEAEQNGFLEVVEKNTNKGVEVPTGYMGKGLAVYKSYFNQIADYEAAQNIFDRAEHLGLLAELRYMVFNISLNYGSHGRKMDLIDITRQVCVKGFASKMDMVEKAANSDCLHG